MTDFKTSRISLSTINSSQDSNILSNINNSDKSININELKQQRKSFRKDFGTFTQRLKSKNVNDSDDAKFSALTSGVEYNCKFIGNENVKELRGKLICQEALQSLKAKLKTDNAHKPKIIFKISLIGISIFDAKNKILMHKHPVNRISFVSKDSKDNKCFGYIVSLEDKSIKYFGFKAEKSAETIVTSIHDLFMVIKDLKSKINSNINGSNKDNISIVSSSFADHLSTSSNTPDNFFQSPSIPPDLLSLTDNLMSPQPNTVNNSFPRISNSIPPLSPVNTLNQTNPISLINPPSYSHGSRDDAFNYIFDVQTPVLPTQLKHPSSVEIPPRIAPQVEALNSPEIFYPSTNPQNSPERTGAEFNGSGSVRYDYSSSSDDILEDQMEPPSLPPPPLPSHILEIPNLAPPPLPPRPSVTSNSWVNFGSFDSNPINTPNPSSLLRKVVDREEQIYSNIATENVYVSRGMKNTNLNLKKDIFEFGPTTANNTNSLCIVNPGAIRFNPVFPDDTSNYLPTGKNNTNKPYITKGKRDPTNFQKDSANMSRGSSSSSLGSYNEDLAPTLVVDQNKLENQENATNSNTKSIEKVKRKDKRRNKNNKNASSNSVDFSSLNSSFSSLPSSIDLDFD
ncbi:unnamed protein product [Gordionus sp. m RMFG-2023]|uniref:disabled homolog 2-like n=1 Tax=Gordionus sp. m RMFG-2023 TaxID=3053472 RepID=UPI0030E0ADC5